MDKWHLISIVSTQGWNDFENENFLKIVNFLQAYLPLKLKTGFILSHSNTDTPESSSGGVEHLQGAPIMLSSNA